MSKILDALEKANTSREDVEKPSRLVKEVLAQQSQHRNEEPERQAEPEVRAEERGPAPKPDNASRERGFDWRYGAGAAVALTLVLGLYLRTAPLQAAKPTVQEVSVRATAPSAPLAPAGIAQPQPDAKPARRARALPKAVPLHRPDPAYATAHPGWQRYLSDTLEFRVYREKNAVKAIQVLSRRGQPIALEFFHSFLAEIASRDAFKAQKVLEKDGYYLETGKADDVAEVTLYRKKPSREIRGIVVAYL